ncbi:MAG: hypothetical protein ACYCYI_11035 [Saccharofermentanales bacterium]
MLLSRKLAYGGIITALILAVISLSYIMPTADFALFTLSSFFIAILIIEAGVVSGLMAYASSAILITAFYGIYYSVPFIILFGIFPILKGLLEQRFSRIISYIFKGIYFAGISMITASFFYKEASGIILKWSQKIPGNGTFEIKSVWAVVLIAVFILFIYDFALSLLIEFFRKRIQGRYGIKRSKNS